MKKTTRKQKPSSLVLVYAIFCNLFLGNLGKAENNSLDRQIERLQKKYLIPEIPNSGNDDYYLEQIKNIVKENTGNKDPWPVPGSSISIPAGFGAEWRDVFAGGTIASPARGSSGWDGGAVLGFGLGDSKLLALETAVYAYSIIPPFRSGAVTVKLHHMFKNGFAVAAGREGLVQWNAGSGSNWFGVVSKFFVLKDSEDDWCSLLIFHGGIGNGKYHYLNITNGAVVSEAYWAPFGGASLRLRKYLSYNLSWSGTSLDTGLAYTPFKSINLNLATNLIDVLNISTAGRRFSFVGSIGYRF